MGPIGPRSLARLLLSQSAVKTQTKEAYAGLGRYNRLIDKGNIETYNGLAYCLGGLLKSSVPRQ